MAGVLTALNNGQISSSQAQDAVATIAGVNTANANQSIASPTIITPDNASTLAGNTSTETNTDQLSTDQISSTINDILSNTDLTSQQQKDAVNAFIGNNNLSVNDAAAAIGVDVGTATNFLSGNPTTTPVSTPQITFGATSPDLGTSAGAVAVVPNADGNTGRLVDVAPDVSGYAPGSLYYQQGQAGAPSRGDDDTFTNQLYANGGLMALAHGYAQGGMSVGHLGGYSDGGRLLRGPGDGVSDSIPATIGTNNPEPARLADGEFVVPARIVSELGNGSTEAGARELYKMMARIQQARSKTTGKDAVATNTNAHKYLPA